MLGSNVANIGLVLGTTGLLLPGILQGRVSRREGTWLLGSLGVLLLLIWDGSFSRMDAGIILVAFSVYKVMLFRAPREEAIEEVARTQDQVALDLGHPGQHRDRHRRQFGDVRWRGVWRIASVSRRR